MWGCVFKINDASEKFYVTDIVSYWCVGSSLVCNWRSYSDFRWNGIYEGEYVYNVYVHEKNGMYSVSKNLLPICLAITSDIHERILNQV